MSDDLYTIAELVFGKVPADICICRHDYCDSNDSNYYLTLYYKDGSGAWRGLDSNNNHVYISAETAGISQWKLWTKPKKKVKMWLWAYKMPSGFWFKSNAYCKSEEEFREYHLNESIKHIKRLDHTEIEVEE